MGDFSHMVGSGKTVWSGRNLADLGLIGVSSERVGFGPDHLHLYDRFYQSRSVDAQPANTRLLVTGIPEDQPVNFFGALHTNFTQNPQMAMDHYQRLFEDRFTDSAEWGAVVTLGNVDPQNFTSDGLSIDAVTDATLTPTTPPVFQSGKQYAVRFDVDAVHEGAITIEATIGFTNQITGAAQTSFSYAASGNHHLWLEVDPVDVPTISVVLTGFRGIVRGLSIFELTQAGNLLDVSPPPIPFGGTPYGTFYGTGDVPASERDLVDKHSWTIADEYTTVPAVGFRIEDAGNEDGYISVGRLWVSQAIQFPRSVDHKVSRRPARRSQDGHVVDVTMSGLDHAKGVWGLATKIIAFAEGKDQLVILNPKQLEDGTAGIYHGFVSLDRHNESFSRHNLDIKIEDKHTRNFS